MYFKHDNLKITCCIFRISQLELSKMVLWLVTSFTVGIVQTVVFWLVTPFTVGIVQGGPLVVTPFKAGIVQNGSLVCDAFHCGTCPDCELRACDAFHSWNCPEWSSGL
jgi:hypothetical protein